MVEQQKTVEVVAALIFGAAGRVLATQCAPHKHGGGWEFPGGKLEPGEQPQEAVVREIYEELGVYVEVGELLHTVEWDYATFHLRMYCYVCRCIAGEIQLREHVAAQWLDAAALGTLQWLPADVELLEPLRKRMLAG